jgi:hypothetical protein
LSLEPWSRGLMHAFRTMEDTSKHILWKHAFFVLSEISNTMFSISAPLNESPCTNIQKDEKQTEGELHLEYILERHYAKEQTGRLFCSVSQRKSKCCTMLSQHISPPGNILSTWNMLSKETSRLNKRHTYGRSYILEASLVSQKLWRDSSVGLVMGYSLDYQIPIQGRGKFILYCKASRPGIESTSLLFNG